MVILLVGLIIAGIGIGLLFAKKGADNKALNIRFVETSNVKELLESAQHIIEQLGAGHFNTVVEVKGKVTCDSPLEAEFSKTPCVYFSTKVEREYEVEETTTDSQGNKATHRVRRSEVLSNNKRIQPFFIEDASGKILIDMEGESPESIQTFNHFEREAPQGFFSTMTTPTKTLGYRKVEYCLPLNQQMYILGEANDRNGELRISKPLNKENSFIVSTKTEEQLIKTAEQSSRGLYYGGIALIVLGAALSIYGIVKAIF